MRSKIARQPDAHLRDAAERQACTRVHVLHLQREQWDHASRRTYLRLSTAVILGAGRFVFAGLRGDLEKCWPLWRTDSSHPLPSSEQALANLTFVPTPS